MRKSDWLIYLLNALEIIVFAIPVAVYLSWAMGAELGVWLAIVIGIISYMASATYIRVRDR
jgi:hypothetical protein